MSTDDTTPTDEETPSIQEGNATTFKCESCGSALSFAPGTDSLTCPYCKSENVIESSDEEIRELDFREHLRHAVDKNSMEEHITVTCDGCGARTDLQPNVTASHCPFCDSPLLAQHVSEKRFKPKSLLPFSIPKNDAQERFKGWIKSRWFAPNAFYKSVRPDKLSGVYCPFWTFDAATHTRYSGERGVYYYVTKTETVTVNGKKQTRTRQVRKTRWRRVSGSVYDDFDDLLVRASRGLPEKPARNLEPWDLHKLLPFQPEYLSGFKVESYTIGLEEGFGDAQEQMKATVRHSIEHDIGGDKQRIHSANTSYSDVTFKHILLPVWISAYRYREKSFRFLINANTGEVQGERPYSIIKITLLCIAIAAVVGTIAFFTMR